MKSVLWFIPLVAVLALLVGCGDGGGDVAFTKTTAKQPAASPGQGGGAENSISGKVVETMDVEDYTYVLVDTGKAKVWAAGPKTKIAVGDQVNMLSPQLMTGFKSSTLDRTFDQIYFVTSFKGDAAAAAPHGAMGGMGGMGGGGAAAGADAMIAAAHGKRAPAATLDFSGLKKAEGGVAIAEIFATKADLGGKEVKIRAKVAKFTPQVMGKNWIHLRDGTGAEGSNDLAVNTAANAKVGDTVLVTGKITLDKDFGFGYKYAVIIEDATVVVE